jgi:ATP-dependent helicase/nuclease subunit B
MSLSVRVAAYGDEVFGELSRALEVAQAGDPLRLVTVVVRRGPVGLAVRRRLAAAPSGIVNVRFLTLVRLAGELAGQTIAGRRPASPAIVHEAARLVLAESTAGFLASGREQPATVRALVRTYGELSGVSPATLTALAGQSARTAEVVRLVAAVRERLAGHVDDAALVAAAVAAIGRDPVAVTTTGPVVVYLPRFVRPTDQMLVHALAEHVPVTVVVGSTGDREVDGVELRPWPSATRGAGAEPAAAATGTRVLVAPSADAEILLVVRQLMAANAAGTPLERMAVVHGGAAPYPRLVHDTLEGAGIPFNGTGVRSLASTVAGRTLLGLFELVDHGWRRDQVTAWLTSAPLRHRGRPIPATAWDVLSAAAGVVGGLSEWVDRPAAYAAGQRERAAMGPDDGSARQRAADRSEWLSSFMAELGRHVAASPTSWAGWAEWAKDRLDQLLGGPSSRADWPTREVAALEAVIDGLTGLIGLDDLGGPGPGLADFRAALAAELDAPAPQTSRFGRGVLVGRVGDVVGLDLDVLCVVGMAEGAFPERSADDVLVPDRDREACGDELPLRAARAVEARRDYLAALAAAPVRLLSCASGDQRLGRELRPSRLLLDTAEVVVGADRRLHAGDLADLPTGPTYERVPSLGAAVAGSAGFDEPVSEADWDRQHLVRWTGSGRRLARHFLAQHDAVLERGLELRRGRRGARFSRFDGRLDDVVVATPAGDGSVQSATGLEAFAACPRRYLFSHVLGIDDAARPEAILQMGASERGNLIHRILERFVADELARPAGERVRPDRPWGPEAYDRLGRLADEAFVDVEQRGLTGRASLWQMDRSGILADLRHFLREDDRYRAATGAVPEAVEQRFGWDRATPVSISLGDGRSVRFRGTVDRIDRLPGGGLSVLDYKTGGRYGVDVLADDPVARGTRLQLVLYGMAAAHRYRADGPVDVGYWFVSDRGSVRGRFPRDGFRLTAAAEGRFQDVLRTLVDAIEAGRFPANPGPPEGLGGRAANCRTCPFDRICPGDRSRAWDHKRDDPWAAGYVALADAG